MTEPDKQPLHRRLAAQLSNLINIKENHSAMATNQAAARRNATAVTQDKLQQKALEQLAIIGGQLTVEDDITFEGKKFIFPEQYQGDLKGMVTFVSRYADAQAEMIVVDKVFNYRPYDGAHAVFHCLKEFFGYAQSKARQGIFGPQPPREVTIPVGYFEGKLREVTVPFGSDMVLPGLQRATLTITSQRTPMGELLYLTTTCRRVDKAVIDGFYNVVTDYLARNSIYRGHAVDGAMNYIDTAAIDPQQFIFTETALAQLETHILSPIVHADVLAKEGLASKRVVLLEGPYGSGKSGMGRIAAKAAVAHGVTAIIARPGVDDPFAVMQLGRLYQPSMIFIEDVDTFSSNLDPAYVTKLLDQFDGFGTKDLRMLLVLTTNHADRIHKGMLRPGRLDAVIHIGAMDRAGVEELCKLVVGTDLAADTNFDEVFEATQGFMPAYVREAIERAVRYTIARLGRTGLINTKDLVAACESLRAQYDLQSSANDQHEKLPPLDRMFREMITAHATPAQDVIETTVDERIEYRLNGAQIVKPSGDRLGQIITN